MLLWPFNKYPGTDYETFNWDWLLRTVKTLSQKVDDLYSTGLYDFVKKILEENPAWLTNFTIPYDIEKTTINNSEAYIIKISKAFPIKMHNTNVATEPTKYAADNNLMCVFNAGYYGDNKPYYPVIQDGQYWGGSQYVYTGSNQRAVLGIDYNNQMREFPLNTDPDTLIANNIRWSTTGYGMVMANGAQLISNTQLNPLQSIADDSGFWYFITVNGRSTDNIGCSVDQLAAFGINRGYDHLFVLDGGGSLNTVIEGVEMADYVDDFGTNERNLYSMFYFEYPENYVNNSAVWNRVNRLWSTLSKTILTLKKNDYTGGLPRVDFTANNMRLATSWNGKRLQSNLLDSNGTSHLFSYTGPVGIADSANLNDYDWPLARTTYSCSSAPTGLPEASAGYIDHIPFQDAELTATKEAVQIFRPHNKYRVYQRFISSGGTPSDWQLMASESYITTDINDLTLYPKTGVAYYRVASGTANSPAPAEPGRLIHSNSTPGTNVATQIYIPQAATAPILKRTVSAAGSFADWRAVAGIIESATEPTADYAKYSGMRWFDTTNHVVKTYYAGSWY